MKKEPKTYIIGHKNPDTDSICSAIAYADIKNRTCRGKYIAKRAGAINEETEFVLSYFQVPAPDYLPDVRAQVKDMDIRETPGADQSMSLKRAWNLMRQYGTGTLPIVSEDGSLKGLITHGDIAKSYMDASDNTILAKAGPTYKSIAETLDGQIVVGDGESCFEKGKVWSGASQTDIMEHLLNEGDLVIVGNRTDTQLCAIDIHVSGMIVCMSAKISDSIQKLAREKGIVIISTPHDAFSVGRLIYQSIPIRFFMKSGELVTFRKDDDIEYAKEIMMKKRYREFPVLNAKGKYLGTVSRGNLLSARKKPVILVDHNERSQAVDNIDEAEILEIIDHHRIGSLETFHPVLFRNQPVGCTATILHQIYEETGLEIPRQIAGCLCAAIISDTLLFRSPTCTAQDVTAAKVLAQIAGLDIGEFAEQMFLAGSNFSEKSPEEILYQDYKKFVIENVTFSIGQVSFMSKEALQSVKKCLMPYLEKESRSHGDGMIFFMLTDIMEETTELLCYGRGAQRLVSEAYQVPVTNHCCVLEKVVSRKKQLLPKLMYALQA